jgi:hypothetical protein
MMSLLDSSDEDDQKMPSSSSPVTNPRHSADNVPQTKRKAVSFTFFNSSLLLWNLSFISDSICAIVLFRYFVFKD